jgi:hypothetical protein
MLKNVVERQILMIKENQYSQNGLVLRRVRYV